jgi:hypothetical protein
VCPNCEPQDGFLDIATLATIADDQTGEEIMYRANPGWNSKKLHKGGWMDWALAKWDIPVVWQKKSGGKQRKNGGKTSGCSHRNSAGRQETTVDHGGDDFIHKQNNGLAPVHLLCFININGIKDESSFMVSGCTIKKEGTYAVCHAVTQFPHCLNKTEMGLLKGVTKDLKTDAYHMKSNNLLLYLLPIENIVQPCICVPNIFGIEHNGDLSTKNIQADKVEYLLLEDPNAWSELFVQWMESSNDNDDNDGTDNDDMMMTMMIMMMTTMMTMMTMMMMMITYLFHICNWHAIKPNEPIAHSSQLSG